MKIARIALKDMGLLQALEVRDLSPGLNLLVGPVGSFLVCDPFQSGQPHLFNHS